MRHLILATLMLATPAIADPVKQGRPNVPEFQPAFAGQTRAPEQVSGVKPKVQDFATGLERPWGIVALPDGGYLVTERPGRLRLMGAEGAVSAPISGVPQVLARGQGGLLDVALSPDYGTDNTIFLTYAKPLPGGKSATAAARAVFDRDALHLTDLRDIFVQTPPSPTAAHYGSRIVFDRAGRVYVTTGEHSKRREAVLAQDLDTTYGKVVRLNADGGAAAGNPFGTEVWSYGHRNIQGAALHPETGELWTIEHGPKGGDELNRPEAGKNYGWPVITYGENYNGSPVGRGQTQAEGMEQPVYYWDPVIAPGGIAFYDGAMFPEWQGDLLIASLNPGGLVRLRLQGNKVVAEERFLRGKRLRDVQVAPDGAVLVLFDNSDGAVLRLSR
ncbi:glucose dehydrogenase [Actibacterium mucosum KCTC 23349]|uniref:Glucose dehydrogenase n=1 Tax=Actibacterium mucosum KCTC 23349 TaxID=1454373 RepID=A0A037ZNB8_9RHOB|nr:PQQ-dependent sugar dehydrogenase [Actibacterium mucosum]KAJ57150.1 glucose dehydrogenase [Actibacterium mucosum KCTC 23349]